MKEKLKTTKKMPIQTTSFKKADSTAYYFPINDDKPRPKYESYTTSASYTDDSFYKLKMHCLKSYDSLCFEKRQEMKALVDKCEIITIKNRGIRPESCNDVLSVYCYIYYSKDTFTCFAADYDPYTPFISTISLYLIISYFFHTIFRYIPGAKYAKSAGTTESTKRVSINIVTDAPTTKRTTASTKEYIRPITTTTKENVRPLTTTTKEVVKPVITTIKTSPKPVITAVTTTNSKPVVKNDSPFDGSPLTVSFSFLLAP